MNFVEPIRDRKKIAQIKNQLRGQRRYRDLLLFVGGYQYSVSDLRPAAITHWSISSTTTNGSGSGFGSKSRNATSDTKLSSTRALGKHSKNIWKPIMVLLIILKTSCFSTPRRMVTPNPSSEVRPGSSSFQSAMRLGCEEITAPIP